MWVATSQVGVPWLRHRSKELKGSSVEGVKVDVHDYLNERDTMESQQLFSSDYSTRELAYVLADEISIKSNNRERVTFLEEYKAGPMLGWIRGSICRALDAKDVTVRVINRRKS